MAKANYAPQPKSVHVLGHHYTPGEWSSMGPETQNAMLAIESWDRYAKMGQLMQMARDMRCDAFAFPETKRVEWARANPGLIAKWIKENHPSYKAPAAK